MCLAPKIPPPPEPPPPPPESTMGPGTKPTTIRPTVTARQSLKQAGKGTAGLTIPLSTGSATPSMSSSNLKIGGM